MLGAVATQLAIALAAVVIAVAPASAGTGGGTGAPGNTVAAPAVGAKFGDAADLGSMRGKPLAQPVVGMASTRTGRGYWLVARDGGIFSFGDAAFFGSTGAIRLNQPIVGITPTPSGAGYWFVAADGGVFSFGDARFLGSTGAIRLNQPIVGMAATPTGRGYWLVARDGGIFSFGDARFLGGTGGLVLNQPIVGMTSTSSGAGYWLVARDGAVFSFGDARSFGSAAGRAGQPVVAMARSASNGGYWLGAVDGAVFSFGNAESFGAGATFAPVVGMAATPSGLGYWLVASDGSVLTTAATTSSGSFAFLRQAKQGGPARYNPCVDQHYVINPALSPPGAADEVRAAFDRLSFATGIRFVYDGTTTESHTLFGARDTYQPQRYGNRWAPILISWSSAVVEPLLAGGTLGYGGSTSFWFNDSDESYVTGEVVLDVEQSILQSGFGAGLTRGNLLLHELGHVAGLDHVNDRGQLMYPSIHAGTTDGYAAGDLAGLGQLGAREGCLTVAAPR